MEIPINMIHQKPFRGTQLNRMHPLTKGLVGCWLFNEATGETVFDSSGNGNNGTLENGVAWGGSKFGGGLEFDGVDDHVGMADDDSLNFGTGEFTIALWIYAHSWTSGDILFSKGNDAIGNEYTMYYYSGAHTGVFAEMGDININYQSGMALSTGQWHYIVLLRQEDTGYVYFDGIQKSSANVSGFNNNPTEDLLIGKCPGSLTFHGSIDSVSIYNRALSAEEITWLYREPYAMFEPAFNPAILYSAAPPVGAIMNQFQGVNVGADLYNGVIA